MALCPMEDNGQLNLFEVLHFQLKPRRPETDLFCRIADAKHGNAEVGHPRNVHQVMVTQLFAMKFRNHPQAGWATIRLIALSVIWECFQFIRYFRSAMRQGSGSSWPSTKMVGVAVIFTLLNHSFCFLLTWLIAGGMLTGNLRAHLSYCLSFS